MAVQLNILKRELALGQLVAHGPNHFRGILIRWSKKAENYLAMLHLALGIISWRAIGLPEVTKFDISDSYPVTSELQLP